MIRHLLVATVTTALLGLTSFTVHAASTPQIMAGSPTGRNVAFIFDKGTSSELGGELRIATHLVGNPGARLSIWVDHSRHPLFSRILSTDDCKYGDDGARCRVVVEGRSPAYRQFVISFKRGRTVHVEVRNAGVMQMSEDVSLVGFTRNYGG